MFFFFVVVVFQTNQCFYDNITYTQFIHTDEGPALTAKQPWSKRSASFRNAKDLLDPYAILLENRLDVLRPKLDSVLRFVDPYLDTSCKSAQEFMNLRRQLLNCKYLQLVSQRSRPEAFLSPDPERSDPGTVDIKIVKIGIVYRREAKRMLYSKPTWREWGAILTASQLYLFKDTTWIKKVAGSSQIVIRPPPEGFHPTSAFSTSGLIALQPDVFDTSAFSVNTIASVDEIRIGSSAPYHISDSGNRFCFVLGGRGGAQDWFSTESADELADWVAKINVTGCFSTYHGSIETDHVKLLGDVVRQRLLELDDSIEKVDTQLQESVRLAKHLRLLAPIQQRTREAVIYAAARLAAKLDWYYLDRSRLYCYRALFRWEQCCLPDMKKEVEELQAQAAARAASNLRFLRGEHTPEEFAELPLNYRNKELQLTSHASTPPPEGYVPTKRDSSEAATLDSDHSTNGLYIPERRSSDASSLAPSLRDIERMHRGDSSRSDAEDNDNSPIQTAILPKRSLQQTLRAGNNGNKQKDMVKNDDIPQRSASLVRKEQGGFTLHGRKFTVVEVNPDFAAASNYQRSVSRDGALNDGHENCNA